MTRLQNSFARALTCAVVFGLFALLPIAANGQGNTTVTKVVADLAPPAGAADATPKGKATAFYKQKGDSVSQRLAVTLEHLEKRTDYTVVIDGFLLGTIQPKGNSGTVVLRYRDPARGHQTLLPIELEPLSDLQTIQVFKVETGELILEGTFDVVE